MGLKTAKHQTPTNSSIHKRLSRNRHIIYRRAIKEESKVANRDLVDHQECGLLLWVIHNGANWLKKIKTKLKKYIGWG